MAKRKRKLKKGVFGIFLIIIIAAVLGVYSFYNKNSNVYVYKSSIVKNDLFKVNMPKQKVDKLSMVMVGDGLLHKSVWIDGQEADGSWNFKKQLTEISDIISKYDLKYYNQESILGGTEIGLSTYPCFNSPQEYGDAMIETGFNLVSLANNHTLDRGEKAIINSVNYWKSKENVMVAGSYLSEEERTTDDIREINGIKYTMLSYTTNTNGLVAPAGKGYLVDTWDYDKAKADIERLRSKVDLLVVAMHWGEEYTHTPVTEQRNIAQFLADNKVDIIIGAHPHVVEPIDFIGNTLVIYSLGNFISAQTKDGDFYKLVELMASCDVYKITNGDSTRIEIKNVNGELLYNYMEICGDHFCNFKIVPFSKMNTSYHSDYKRLYNKYSKVITSYSDKVTMTPCAE